MGKTSRTVRHILKPSFFARPTLAVARDLLGKYLVRRLPPARPGARPRTIALMITEVEAYDGPRDRASHAHRGMTPRTAVMFGPPGVWYVYFTYGMHWILNVVTGSAGYPAAVLIRAGMGPDGPIKGPARLTKFLQITKVQNKQPATLANGLWIEDRGIIIPRSAIIAGPRVGVDYAGPEWAGKPYNFKMKFDKG